MSRIGTDAIRVLVAAVALIACAWYALCIHQNDDLSAATSVAEQAHPTAAQVRHADALLSSAAVLNPDRTVAITRAQVALVAGHPSRARAILARVVSAEPDNFDAWTEMVRASADDRTEREIAFAKVLSLDPPVKGS